jgi:hypothetical protein
MVASGTGGVVSSRRRCVRIAEVRGSNPLSSTSRNAFLALGLSGARQSCSAPRGEVVSSSAPRSRHGDQPRSSRVLTATSMGGAAPGIHETPSSRKPWVARREVRTAGRAAGSCLRSLASAAGSTPASRSRWTSGRTACGCGRPAPRPSTGRGSTRPARPAAGSPAAAQQGRGDRSHQAACNLAPSLATSACSRAGLKGRPKLVKLADSSTRPFPSRMASW